MVQSLVKDGVDTFQHAQRHFPDSDLVFQKGTYCYEYIDSRDKFEDAKLPLREQFYSHLKEESVSDDEYAHAQKIWNEFNIQNLRQYHNLYLTLDVLLLADVFETFAECHITTTNWIHVTTTPFWDYLSMPVSKWRKWDWSCYVTPNNFFLSKIVFVEECQS